uniref:Uncharacterized protein n=1 Tax=Neovison vison TaxID=452646 RepID=A0A8C7EL59_NEOVI
MNDCLFMYLFVRIVHTISPNVIVCKSALSRFVVLFRVTWVANQAANQNTIFCINVIKLKKRRIDAEDPTPCCLSLTFSSTST